MMNGYIYWHLAVEEYCKEIYSSEHRSLKLMNMLTSISVMVFSLFAIQWIGQKSGIRLLESYAPFIGLAIGLSDMALFYVESKRHRRWMEQYNRCRTDEKDFCCFLLACAGIIAAIVLLFIGD